MVSCRRSRSERPYAEPAETRRDLLRLTLAHESVFDEDGLQLPAEGAMTEHGDGGRVDAAREGVDRNAVPDGIPDLLHLFSDELPGVQLSGGDFLDH